MEPFVAVSGGLWNPMAYFALAVGLFLAVVIAAAQFRLLPAAPPRPFKPEAHGGRGNTAGGARPEPASQ